jgi:cytoskeletal protein CcmA (bactofilin family)
VARETSDLGIDRPNGSDGGPEPLGRQNRGGLTPHARIGDPTFWALSLGLWRTDLAAQRRGARALEEPSMFGPKQATPKQSAQKTTPIEGPTAPLPPLLTIIGDTAKVEGKFEIADSIQIECEVGGELRVGGKLVIGEKGVVRANVETVDAIILGHYDGNMTATGNVEIAATGRVSGNIKTDSLVITKGGCFKGNVAKINDEPVINQRPRYLLEDKNGQTLEAARLSEGSRKV